MARLARVVVPRVPHHVTQWGNRDLEVFFSDEDYQAYIDLVAPACEEAGTQVWAYCLMPSHVHLIMVPSTEDGLRAALGEAHRRYTRLINEREGWRGHLWQERFHSLPMDNAYLAACARYVEQSPVREKLVRRPERWPWSSANAHLEGEDDELVWVGPLLKRHPDWRAFLKEKLDRETLEILERHGRTGRPLGSRAFVRRVEDRTGRQLAPGRPGRPPKTAKRKRRKA